MLKQPESHRFSDDYTSQSHHQSPKGMHATVLNGPTLSPQGQGPPKMPPSLFAGNQPYNASQGSQSPATAPAYTKSYSKTPSQQNQYSHQPRHPYQSSMANGNAQVSPRPLQGSHQPPQQYQYAAQSNQQVGWSARYMPPQTPQNLGPLPATSHSRPNTQSPSRQGPSQTSTQDDLRTFGDQSNNAHQTSGSQTQTSLPTTGSHSISPTKHASPQTASAMGLPLSSPTIHQPPLQPTGPRSPGISPVKHSPPLPTAPTTGISNDSNPTAIPPVAQFSPNSAQQNLSAPMKVMTSEQSNTPVHHQDRNGVTAGK